LPPRERAPRAGGTAASFVVAEKLFARTEATRCETVVSETPRSHAEPAEVFDRIADVRQLPVEHGGQAGLVEHDVADPEVAVHERGPAHFGRALLEPPRCQTKQRVRLVSRHHVEDLPVAFDL